MQRFLALISAFTLLGCFLLLVESAKSMPPVTAPQQMQFSVYVHDKETKIVTGSIDIANANAYGTYNFNSSVAGWNMLEISANQNPTSSKSHLDNMYAMGFAEGYASCNEIHTFWPNFYSDLFGDLVTPPGAQTLKFIRDQWAWMGTQISAHAETDAFWYAQQQTRHQLEGLFAGFQRAACSRPGGASASSVPSPAPVPARPNSFWATLDAPTLEHFLLINAWGDLYQITVKMKEPGQFSRLHGKAREVLVERCSAFIKLLPNNEDVFFGHNTWDSYQSLGPRIFKKYHFPLWAPAPVASTASTDLIQYTTLFSSSPALLSSIDDFFVVKGKGHFGVQETTNSLYNLRLLNTIRSDTALSWQRSTAANQLSTTGEEWAKNFATVSSGTYTNQWMVLDFHKFAVGQAPAAGFLTVYEEVPSLFHYEDMTSTLIDQSFWSSYNSPYFSDIRVASGYQKLCDVGITGNCYDKAPRAIIFKQQQGSVTDLTSMQTIMRYNHWQTDSASDGDSCHSIACRGDLETSDDNVGPFGALDAKISSVMLNVNSAANGNDGCSAYAILGPTQQTQAVFCWSNLQNEHNYMHNGQPDCFDFQWVTMH